LDLYNLYEAREILPFVLNTVSNVVYSILLIFSLLWINIEWKGRWSNKEALLFSISLLTTIFLFYLANLIIHQDISDEYFRMFRSGHHHGPDHKINILAIRSFFVLLIVYLGGLIYKLYMKKIEAEKSLDKLRSESLQSKLTALNNQINPHFFFNALNSLYSLIMEDKKESSLSYLSNLSNVFRYILRSETKAVISLKEELSFLEEYKSMMSVKYGNKLIFDCRIEERYLSYKLPVLTLLPIIENVAKHNEISSTNPMVIHICTDDDNLIIMNKIKKKIDPVLSEGIGLKNLNNRFKILLNKEIKIKMTHEDFYVYLPLIRESDESHYN
ncbi:MAG: histidine kinase, partial [Bacteroidota bacterium]|nr:histidine kinase [Bacteroidota bacterium]